MFKDITVAVGKWSAIDSESAGSKPDDSADLLCLQAPRVPHSYLDLLRVPITQLISHVQAGIYWSRNRKLIFKRTKTDKNERKGLNKRIIQPTSNSCA